MTGAPEMMVVSLSGVILVVAPYSFIPSSESVSCNVLEASFSATSAVNTWICTASDNADIKIGMEYKLIPLGGCLYDAIDRGEILLALVMGLLSRARQPVLQRFLSDCETHVKRYCDYLISLQNAFSEDTFEDARLAGVVAAKFLHNLRTVLTHFDPD